MQELKFDSEDILWKDEESIYTLILENVNEDGELNSMFILPDDDDFKFEDIRLVPGLSDAMRGVEISELEENVVEEILQCLYDISVSDSFESKRHLIELSIKSEKIVSIIESISSKIGDRQIKLLPHLIPFVENMTFKSSKRNVVKLGISLLGISGIKELSEQLQIFSKHDEFSVYSAVAIQLLEKEPSNTLWEMGKKVHGWGRIQIVSRLVQNPLNQKIKNWLITEGYKNTVMDEYLAYTCVVSGDLIKALEVDSVDDKLYNSSCEIILALLNDESPAYTIDDLEEGSDLIFYFVKHSAVKGKSIFHLFTLIELREYLVYVNDNFSEYRDRGWVKEVVENLLIDISLIINKQDWKNKVYKALKRSDDSEFYYAKQIAGNFEIEIEDFLWEKIEKDSSRYESWYDLITRSKDEEFEKIVNFAIDRIDLEAISTGPKEESGFSDEFIYHNILDHILDKLRKYDKIGEEILKHTLLSPTLRNRNLSIEVISIRGLDNCSDEIKSRIRELYTLEPNKNIKERIKELFPLVISNKL